VDNQITISELNGATADGFADALSEIFESSRWVAERSAVMRPFADINTLHDGMVAVVADANHSEQLALICAHPDLAGKAALAGELTEASTSEQAGAGLDTLSREELARFQVLNETYRSRFQFPFIIAVKGLDKYAILSAYEPRIAHRRDQEIETALGEIAKIARFRLDDLVA
jgi:2-oxo-4-hydroxy-4-carboxy-5-ureidoimidazoline decarboxylase